MGAENTRGQEGKKCKIPDVLNDCYVCWCGGCHTSWVAHWMCRALITDFGQVCPGVHTTPHSKFPWTGSSPFIAVDYGDEEGAHRNR